MVVCVTGLAVLMLMTVTPAIDAQHALPLPPRPSPTPTPPAAGGGLIVLQTTSAPSDAWTVVEWQGTFGSWYVVEGWQGTLENDGTKTWWVDRKNLGKGLFRWRVYQAPGGRLLTTSASFNLPTLLGQSVVVTVTVK